MAVSMRYFSRRLQQGFLSETHNRYAFVDDFIFVYNLIFFTTIVYICWQFCICIQFNFLQCVFILKRFLSFSFTSAYANDNLINYTGRWNSSVTTNLNDNRQISRSIGRSVPVSCIFFGYEGSEPDSPHANMKSSNNNSVYVY